MQASRDAGFILLNGIGDTKQKNKVKTGSLKAASQNQKHIHDTTMQVPRDAGFILLNGIFRHKTKNENQRQSQSQNQNRQLKSCVPKSKPTSTTPQRKYPGTQDLSCLIVIGDIKQRAKGKVKTGSLKAAPQNQNHIHDTANKYPGTQDLSCLIVFTTQNKERKSKSKQAA